MNTLIIISCICMLFVIGRIFIVPIKWILKLVFNSVLGGVIIWIINMVGGVWGFHIGLNIYTSILVRFLRNTWCSCSNSIKVNYCLNRKLPLLLEAVFGRFIQEFQHSPSKSYGLHFQRLEKGIRWADHEFPICL